MPKNSQPSTGTAVGGASSAPILSVHDLHKSFGDNEVLKGISFDVHKGEVVVILGPSGSGKSTILRCLNLLEKPTSGSIVFEGEDICAPSADVNDIRKRLGMVFQQFNLFPHLDALHNVMLAQEKVLKRSKEEAERIALEQLTRVGLADRADYFPDELSGGQQQRVAIARALAMDPHMMLFDEATSALDNDTECRLLRNIMSDRSKTIIFITHRPAVINYCDRTLRVERNERT